MFIHINKYVYTKQSRIRTTDVRAVPVLYLVVQGGIFSWFTRGGLWIPLYHKYWHAFHILGLIQMTRGRQVTDCSNFKP
jgi:hypothetical protein